LQQRYDIFTRWVLVTYGNQAERNTVPNRGNCLADECLMVENLEYPVANLDVEEEALKKP
jgi:hypothetical protein